MRVAMYYSNKRNDTPPFFARPASTGRNNLLPPVYARSRDSSLTLRNRLRNSSLLSLRGAGIPRLCLGTGSAILVEGGGDMCLDVVAGFIPALWSAKRKLPCA